MMTMTPPHMKDHGHGDLSAYVIAVHILGMFGLAPFVGRFVDRVGAVKGVQFGAIVLGAGTVTAVIAGYVPAMIFVGLFLLGLGWNLGLIAGTTLLVIGGAGRGPRRGAGNRRPDAQPVRCGRGVRVGVREAGRRASTSSPTWRRRLAAGLLAFAWLTEARSRRSATLAT